MWLEQSMSDPIGLFLRRIKSMVTLSENESSLPAKYRITDGKLPCRRLREIRSEHALLDRRLRMGVLCAGRRE